MASFFIMGLSLSVQALPGQLTRQWQALLHLKDGKPQITDPAFLLSSPDFSPEKEWNETLKAIRSTPEVICRFPARYEVMKRVVDLPPMPACKEYRHFLKSAPADEISVIYASENLSNPSSMMGHGMLAISGVKADGATVQHSVSFFTELDSLNPFKVIWETMIEGKKGYFLIKPLEQHFEFYNVQEQRNVWRYVLKLDARQRQLLQAHFWELKHPGLDYIFQSHNCATLTLDILRTVKPEIEANAWVSPLDLAKAIDRADLIKQAQLVPSAKWKIRMLTDIASSHVLSALNQYRRAGYIPDFDLAHDRYLFRELAVTLDEYDMQMGQLDNLARQKRQKAWNTRTEESLHLDISHYKSPLGTPDDSQIAAGWLNYNQQQWLSLRWLPAAHTLEDDNRQYFAENELLLNQLELRYSPNRHKLRLHRWRIYSARSLTPRDPLTGGISGGLHLGLEPLYDRHMVSKSGFNMSGGLGVTMAVGPDLRLYGLLNMGMTFVPSQAFTYLEPEVGGYLYEIAGMKSWLRYHPQIRSDGRLLYQWSLSHSLSWKHSAIVGNVKLARMHQHQWKKELQLEWRWYY